MVKFHRSSHVLVLLLLFVTPVSLLSQEVYHKIIKTEYFKNQSYLYGEAYGYYCEEDSLGNIILYSSPHAGTSTEFPNCLIKLDKYGKLLKKTIVIPEDLTISTSYENNWGVHPIIKTTDSGYFITAHPHFYAKIDKDFNYEWGYQNKTVTSSYWGSSYRTSESSTGYISGLIEYFGSGKSAIGLVKFDLAGDLKWKYRYEFNDSVGIHASHISRFNDTSCIVVNNIDVGNNEQEISLIKVSDEGDKIWSYVYKITQTEQKYRYLEVTGLLEVNGNIYITGRVAYGGFARTWGFVSCIDSLGNIIWFKKYQSSMGHDYARCIVNVEGSGLLIGGTAGSLYSPTNDFASLFKIDYAGNILWAKTIGESFNENGVIDIFVTNDGSIVLTGVSLRDGKVDIPESRVSFLIKTNDCLNSSINEKVLDIVATDVGITKRTEPLKRTPSLFPTPVYFTSYENPKDLVVETLNSDSNLVDININFTNCTDVEFETSFNDVAWSFTEGDTVFSSSANYTYPALGTYTYSLTAYDECLADTVKIVQELVIDESKFTIPKHLGEDDFLCQGTHIVNAQVNADSYLWSTGETTEYIEITSTGAYWVKVEVNGCFYKDTIVTTMVDCGGTSDEIEYFIPNIFTPNNDGVNDFLSVENIEELNFTVRNRWGIIVFESTAKQIEWNGKNEAGKEVDEGIYFATLGNSEKDFAGFIHLVRE